MVTLACGLSPIERGGRFIQIRRHEFIAGLGGAVMRRRHFIAALTGAASSTIWPSAGAQQAERTSRVGVLFLVPQSQLASILLALRDGLKRLGWTEDRNLQLYVRNHPTDAKVIDAYADELVRLAPEVIVTSSYLATRAVQQRTRTIPIVFVAVGDPIEKLEREVDEFAAEPIGTLAT